MTFGKCFLALVLLIEIILCADACCVKINTTVTCSGCVPTEIKLVYIYNVDFALHSRETDMFRWHKLEELTIIPEKDFDEKHLAGLDRFTLRSNTFAFLTNLKVVRFSSSKLLFLEQGVFSGLEKLEVLNLSGCLEVTLANINIALQGIKMPDLKCLILRNLSQLSTQLSVFDRNFFEPLQRTQLEHLDLSHTNSLLDVKEFSVAFPYLKRFDFEHGGFLAVNFILALIDYGNGSTFRNLRNINANYPTIPKATFMPGNSADLKGEAVIPQNFSEVRVRACTPVSRGFVSELYTKKLNGSVVIVLNFTNANIQWNVFNLATFDDGSIPLEILDIGENGIERVDSTITEVAINLKYLDVSDNNLHKMNISDFEKILRNMKNLLVFNCSRNSLKGMPHRMFGHENKLRVIDLSFNEIEVIDFDFTFLNDLEVLDLRFNNIHFLPGSSLNMLDAFLQWKYNNNLSILINHNPINCACGTKYFIKWLLNAKRAKTFSYDHKRMCFLNGNSEKQETIDEFVIPEIDFLCAWPKIIAAICSVIGIVFVLVIAATTFFCRRYRARQKKKKFMNIVSMHKLNQNRDKFPVFLSYCSSDADIVETHILTVLDTKLQGLLETNKQCISTGDRSFTPGFHVAEEIATCVESTDVMVACVSRHFCNSPFCKDELVAAHHANKPIILLFLEEVDTKSLPKFIQTHFKFITRAKICISDTGIPIFTPDVDSLCRAIIMLTKTSLKNNPGL